MNFIRNFIDLKLAWSEGDKECISVPRNVYQDACITDAQKGVEVRSSIDIQVTFELKEII